MGTELAVHVKVAVSPIIRGWLACGCISMVTGAGGRGERGRDK